MKASLLDREDFCKEISKAIREGGGTQNTYSLTLGGSTLSSSYVKGQSNSIRKSGRKPPPSKKTFSGTAFTLKGIDD